MTRRQMLKDIIEHDRLDQTLWECPMEYGPSEYTKQGTPIWPKYCSIYTSYHYDYGSETDCNGPNGRYSCEVMQAILDATGSEKLHLWQLSKSQLAEVHAYLIE